MKEGLPSCPASCIAPTKLTGNSHGASDLHLTHSQQSQQSQLRDNLSTLIPSENISTVANSSIKSQNLDNNMRDIKS